MHVVGTRLGRFYQNNTETYFYNSTYSHKINSEWNMSSLRQMKTRISFYVSKTKISIKISILPLSLCPTFENVLQRMRSFTFEFECELNKIESSTKLFVFPLHFSTNTRA